MSTGLYIILSISSDVMFLLGWTIYVDDQKGIKMHVDTINETHITYWLASRGGYGG